MHGKTFWVNEDHIKLIRAMNVRWEQREAGAPAVDPKRPYGNSDVAGDVLRILGRPELAMADEIDEALEGWAWSQHRNAGQALECCLQAGSLEPGEYRRAACAPSQYTRWERVGP